MHDYYFATNEHYFAKTVHLFETNCICISMWTWVYSVQPMNRQSLNWNASFSIASGFLNGRWRWTFICIQLGHSNVMSHSQHYQCVRWDVTLWLWDDRPERLFDDKTRVLQTRARSSTIPGKASMLGCEQLWWCAWNDSVDQLCSVSSEGDKCSENWE